MTIEAKMDNFFLMDRSKNLKELIAYVDDLGLLGRTIFNHDPKIPSSPELSRLELIIVAKMDRTEGTLGLNQIAAMLSCKKQQASRLVGRLVKAGYLSKKTLGRNVEISISEEGKQRYAIIEKTRLKRMEKAISPMKDQDLSQALELISRLRNLFSVIRN